MIEPSNIDRVLSAEGWESLLIVLAIMIFSGLANLVKKFQGQPRDTSWEDESQPAPSPSRPAQSSWEDELRRMLEEEKPKHVAPPLLAPTMYKPATLRPSATVHHQEEGPSSPSLAHLTQSATVYERAAALHERVAAHLHQVGQHTELHRPALPVAHTKQPSAEAEAAVALLRKPASARQAIIASIILGTPKSLEN